MQQFKMSALALVVFVCCLLAFGQPAQAASPVLVLNKTVYADQQADLIEGRVYVPLRVISEGLGYQVNWYDSVRLVTINRNGSADVSNNVTLTGRIQIQIEGNLLATDANRGYPYLKNGRTMVPLRAIAEGLGADVSWDSNTNTVTVNDTAQEDGNVGEAIAAPSVEADPYLPLTPHAPGAPTIDATQWHAGNLTLSGPSLASLDQINAYLANKEKRVRDLAAQNGKTFVPFPADIGRLYYEIGQRYNIRGDIALAQALHETGNFQYGNEVLPAQNNYCGLGAIGRKTTSADLTTQAFAKINHERATLIVDTNGWWYQSPACGVEAHIQHLYSYASANALPPGCELVDGRFNHGNRGKAVYWSDLNGKWAVPGHGYGEIIIDRYWKEMI